MAHLQINAEQIRRDLLARCDAYCTATGTARTTLSVSLTNATNYLTLLEDDGRNLTLRMVEKIQIGLEKLECRMERFTNDEAREIYKRNTAQLRRRKAQAERHRGNGKAVRRTNRANAARKEDVLRRLRD